MNRFNPLAPWLARYLAESQHNPAGSLLLTGPRGAGVWECGAALATRWLCQLPLGPRLNATQGAACGTCPSCHWLSRQTHPDVFVLSPEAECLRMGFALPEKTQKELDDKKRKPSLEIKIDDVRACIEFCQRTASSLQAVAGEGVQTATSFGVQKVVLVYPAEQMGSAAANALLKVLEEPPPGLRFVLLSEAPGELLPTLRSRCVVLQIPPSDAEEAHAWLTQCFPSLEPQLLATVLRRQGGAALGAAQALAAHSELGEHKSAEAKAEAAASLAQLSWQGLTQQLKAAQFDALAAWPLRSLTAALQKLAADLSLYALGQPPRYFGAAELAVIIPKADKPQALQARLAALSEWHKALQKHQQHIDHPYKADLFQAVVLAEAAACFKKLA